MNWDVRASSVRFMGICCISCPSNQKDGAASVEGSRLAVIDAKTMQVKKEFQTINSAGADGRLF